MATDHQVVNWTHGRQASADDANAVLCRRPYSWVGVVPSCIWERQAVHYRNAIDAARADEAAKKEDANQLYLPLPLHMKIPNWGQWHEYGSEIRGHIEHPKDCRYQPGIETKARNFHVPCFVDRVTLEDRAKDFGYTVAENQGRK